MHGMFSMYALGGKFNNLEYFNLTEEEKSDLDYMNQCIFSENEKINNASFHIMMMLIELSDDPDKYEPEDIQIKKEEIYKGLTPEEISIMEKSVISCINCMGIYSDDRVQERKLNKREE